MFYAIYFHIKVLQNNKRGENITVNVDKSVFLHQFSSGVKNFMNDELIDWEKVFLIETLTGKTKSKDEILAVYNKDASQRHYSSRWNGRAAVFDVTNKTAEHSYTVSFFQTKDARAAVVTCDCAARVECKHIVRAKKDFDVLVRNGFLSGV